jgi:hypothetical protein
MVFGSHVHLMASTREIEQSENIFGCKGLRLKPSNAHGSEGVQFTHDSVESGFWVAGGSEEVKGAV